MQIVEAVACIFNLQGKDRSAIEETNSAAARYDKEILQLDF